MAKLVNREVILAKIESTYNTDPVPTGAADAVLVENLSWSTEGARLIERPAIRPNLGTLRSLHGGTLFQVSFECEVKGSGAAGTAPEIGALLRACGKDETVVASTSVTYAPVSTGHESVTLYYFEDGVRYPVTGCRGNVEFTAATGSKLMASFTMTGHVGTPTDVANPTATYDSTVPAPLISVPFTVGAYAAVIESLTFSMNNEISTPPDISATDGYGEVLITKRDVSGSFNPESTLIATNDFYDDWKTTTAMALSIGSIGSTAGNIIDIDMPAVSYREISQGDRDGLRTYELGFGAAEVSGDDEVSVVFT